MSSLPDYVFDPARLAALDGFSILDTMPEAGFDDIVQLAMYICETPVALVSLVAKDRQSFKARAGFEPCETDLNSSVCAHALVEPDLLVIPDLTGDPRTAANPLVTGEPRIRFYAGAPLRTQDGHAIGSLCVIDGKPRPQGLTPSQAANLRNLARQVMSQLELRKALARQGAFLLGQADADARRTGLLTLGDRVRDLTTSSEMTRAAAEIVGQTLGANRAGFGLLSEDAEYVDVESDWTLPGVPSVAGRHRFADYGRLADDLRAGRPLVIEDVTTDPRTAADPKALLTLNVRSLLNVVVLERGRPTALFFAHFDRPTAWPPEVMAFLRNVADRVETGIARLNAEAQQRVLNHELGHRMKNTMSMVQAIAGQTLKGVTEREAVDAFISRLHALSSAHAHDVLLKRSWMTADIGEVIRNEDEPLLRMAASDMVETAGFEVAEAANATEAVRILETRLDIHIVFSDIDMPAGIDGMKLAAVIRHRWPPIEIILVSGHTEPPEVDLPARTRFFQKPYKEPEIVAALRNSQADGMSTADVSSKVAKDVAASVLWLVIFLSAVSTCSAASAEEQWAKLKTAPYTLNNKQDAIAFAGPKAGWYGNGTGKVYRTNDLGEHWKLVWSHPGTYVRSLEFSDETTGFLGNVGPGYFPNVSDKNPLYVTRDGGEHWSPIRPTTGRQIVGVCGIDVLKIDGKVLAVRAGGRIGGPAAMLESFDEGRTFQARDMSGLTGMILDIHFVDQDVGFIAGASQPDEDKAHARILKTTDGGKTWRAVFDSDRPGDSNWKLAFPTPDIGYATIISYQAADDEARGYVVKTTDGGETWHRQIVTNDKEWIPYGINFLDASHGWVGGSTGGYETRDGGQTWHAAQMGLSTNKIRFVKQGNGETAAFAIGQGLYKFDLHPQSKHN